MENVKKKKEYEAPRTRKSEVRLEETLCTSGEDAKVKIENQTIEVEQYASIDNQVTFD